MIRGRTENRAKMGTFASLGRGAQSTPRFAQATAMLYPPQKAANERMLPKGKEAAGHFQHGFATSLILLIFDLHEVVHESEYLNP